MGKDPFSALRREETEGEAVSMHKKVSVDKVLPNTEHTGHAPLQHRPCSAFLMSSRSGRPETDENVLEALWLS